MTYEINEPAVKYNYFESIEAFFDYIEPIQAKYELWEGELVMMASTTQDHAEIRDNLHSFLKEKLKSKGCKSFQETIYLSDIIVTCNPEDFSGKSRLISNPSIIVEILSESTELHDRGIKWAHYRTLPSLRYYIMVSQQKPMVEVYGRPHAQSLFYFESFEGMDATVDLREMDLKIPMQEIYNGIVFETITELP
jgi:Uma2 family endonuclease